jgi:conflict system STAND superfamily ATPase/TIR domain-containing protein
MADVPSPYVGLRPFALNDWTYFCGREQETQELITRLDEARIVILFGSTGSGKTSFVNAALVHGLTEASRPWHVATLRLRGQTVHGQSLAAWDPITEEEIDLLTWLRPRDASERRALVIVDQFEELFALEHRIEERRRIIDELLPSAEGRSAHLLLVVRTDFLGAVLEDLYVLRRVGGQNAAPLLFPLPALTRDVLRAAAIRPALQSGVRYEEGLVDEIMDDLGPGPTKLAYLQAVLLVLWNSAQRSQTRLITREVYNAQGRADGVLQPLRELDSWTEQVRPLFLAWDRSGRPREFLLFGPLLERGKLLTAGPTAGGLPFEYGEYLRQSTDAEQLMLFSRRAFHQTLKALQLPKLARKLTDAEREFAEANRRLTDTEELNRRYTQRLKELEGLMEKNTPKVFISYAREDQDDVFRVYNELRAQGLRPWIDKRDIPVGKEWDREIAGDADSRFRSAFSFEEIR